MNGLAECSAEGAASMRRYDDPVDVRRGRVAGPGSSPGAGRAPGEAPSGDSSKGPSSSCGRAGCGRCTPWSRTGWRPAPWWQSSGAHAVLGADDWETGDGPRPAPSHRSGHRAGADLAAEREVWRVEAARGMSAATGRGVFDLVFDWADGSWRLTRCLD